MVQGIFLMSFLKYYDLSYFKRFKKIGWKFFKKLRQSIFLIMGTYFILKFNSINFKQNNIFYSFNFIFKIKLVPKIINDDIILTVLKVRRDNL